MPPQATGLSMGPQEWVQRARGAAGADGDDGKGMCLQGRHAGSAACGAGQGCWDLTAPAPGTPSCGGLLSSVRLLAPGLPLAHSPVTCSAVVCCSSFLCATVGFLGHHQPRWQISSRAWTELQVLSDRVNRGETRNQVGAGDWCSHLCPSAASWPRTRQ